MITDEDVKIEDMAARVAVNRAKSSFLRIGSKYPQPTVQVTKVEVSLGPIESEPSPKAQAARFVREQFGGTRREKEEDVVYSRVAQCTVFVTETDYREVSRRWRLEILVDLINDDGRWHADPRVSFLSTKKEEIH